MLTHGDLETRSALDLTKVGAHRYAEDPSTEIIVASCGDEAGPDRFVAHNASFERVMLNAYGAGIQPEDMDCTLARAAVLSLPQSLDGAAMALDTEVRKDEVGRRLMLRMCKAGYEPKPGEWDRLRSYCDTDRETETAIGKLLPPLSPSERATWVLDQKINDRGFAIDTPRVAAAQAAVEEAKRLADRRMWEITEGAVEKCSQAARIVTWLNGRGIPAESIAEGETDELLVKTDLFLTTKPPELFPCAPPPPAPSNSPPCSIVYAGTDEFGEPWPITGQFQDGGLGGWSNPRTSSE